ncbi:MAG: transglutaminase-like domain-containing protein, partial [Clostridia bacterium]
TPVIEWFIAKDKEAPIKIEGETKKVLTYKFTEFSPSVYTFFAIVNNVKSNLLVKVALQYATLENVEITSPNTLIVQDVIQQDLANLKAVDFVVNFDATYFAPEYSKKISVKWLVDGVETGISTKTFSYQPTAIKVENHIIAVEVLAEGSSLPIKDFVTISIVEKFDAVESVRLNLQGGATSNEKGYYTQFDEIANANLVCKNVDLSLAVLPELGTNLLADAVWKHRTESGTVTLTNVERTVSVLLKPGKNVFSAVVDNVESRELTVYALTENEYKLRKPVIDDTFIWNGNLQSFYIMDNNDLDCVVSKMVADRKIATTVADKNCKNMFLQPASWKNGGSVSSEFSPSNEGSTKKGAMQKALDAVDESGRFTFSFNATTIFLTSQSFFGTPSGAYPTTVKVEQAKVLTNFSSSTVNRTALPIDLVTETLEVEDTNMLMRALSWGLKPIFAPSPNGAATKAVYDKARAVLYDINDDNMTEYEKVRAIYQWITASVAYDYKVLEIPDTDDETFKRTLNYNAFYLEGVFNDGRAVCDGKSKAFALMCGMEGIKA